MARTTPYRLILASSSVARRYLLERAGYAFDVVPSNVDETCEAEDARSLVQILAWRKASAIAARLAADSATADRLPTVIVAADSVGWHGDQVIGKPEDRADARRILRLLGGVDHELWTGTCVWLAPGSLHFAWQESSLVHLEALSDADLDAYLDTNAWVGCSGAYAIREDGHDPLVRVRKGSVTNVMGLPMESLVPLLDLAARADLRSAFHVPT